VPAFLRRPRPFAKATRSWGPVRILDHYVASSYARVLVLAAVALAGIFYISTFLDLSDKVFKGDATWGMMGRYFVFVTPQYVYYIIPLAVLVAALVTISVLTKNNELIASVGISHASLADGGVRDRGGRAVASKSVLGPGEPAAILNNAIRGNNGRCDQPPMGGRVPGEIYHYDFIDAQTRRCSDCRHEFGAAWSGSRATFAQRATALTPAGGVAPRGRLDPRVLEASRRVVQRSPRSITLDSLTAS
jgi:hypothetical protein